MLGPWLLAAPVLTDQTTSRTIYLPAGRWFEYHSGAVYEGPTTLEVKVTLGALPLFVREGAILPRAQPMMWSDQEPVNPLYLDVYPGPGPTSFTLYEDDGDSMEYEDGAWSKVRYSVRRTETGAVLEAEGREGSFEPSKHPVVVRVRRVDHAPTAVMLDGQSLPEFDSLEQALAVGPGWWYDEYDLSLVVVLADEPPFQLEMEYDTALLGPAPPVMMPFEVTVPPGTSLGTPIHIALSSNAWSQVPLQWGDTADTAVGLVPVPRGEWFYYKYTRGDWDTVEKWAGCLEASNRYAFGAAHPVKQDQVETWADWCGQ